MEINGTVLVYILAAVVAVSAATVTLLLIRIKDSEAQGYLKYMALFITANFLIGGMYLWETIYESHFISQGYGIVYRVADICLYVVQSFAWTGFVLLFTGKDYTKVSKAGKPFHVVMLLLCAVTYGFLLDSHFASTGISATVLECIIALCMSVYQIWAGMTGFRAVREKGIKIYIVAITSLILLNGWWSSICTVYMTKQGRYYDVAFDYTSICLALIAVATVVYIYRTDFSAVLLENGKGTRDIKNVLESAAGKYGFTDREKEVFFLAYEGLSNSEIAEHLFISKYTVKHHMHNIFEKMNVSGRVDMLLKVQEEG